MPYGFWLYEKLYSYKVLYFIGQFNMKFIKGDFATLKNKKKIAILLATLNSKDYIDEMILSLFGQSFDDFCIFVHDDGSKDDTQVILEDYERTYPDKIVIMDYPATGSAKANFFSMMEAVESDYYMFADHDDVWLKDKLKLSYEKIQEIEKKEETILNINDVDTTVIKSTTASNESAENPPQSENLALDELPGKPSANNSNDTGHKSAKYLSPSCAFTDMYVTDADLNITSSSFVRFIDRDPYNLDYHRLIIDNPAAGCSMIFNRSLRDKAMECENLENIDMHDHFLISLAAVMGNVAFIDLPLNYYRQHGDNEMGAGVSESAKDKVLRNLKEFFSGKARANKRAFNDISRKLAGEIVKVSGIAEDKKAELEAFANIGKKGKLCRIAFYSKHGFDRKSGNFWFYIWL